jgi:catalase
MPTDAPPLAQGNPPPAPPNPRPRITLLAAILALIVLTFTYLGGWLTPHELTPQKFADAFQAADGLHPGFRRNHAKGVCVSGFFDSNGNGAALSTAAVFQPGRTPVVGRFSLSGGNPFQHDTPNQVRGLGLQLITPAGQEWRTAMINLPVFPANTPQAFYDRTLATVPDPATGKPDPAKMQAFLAAHPETVAALKILKQHPPSPGFADSTFHSLNAFIFTSSQGTTTPVRWIFEPVESNAAPNADLGTARATDPAPTTQPASPSDPNYLFDNLIAQINAHPLQWHLILIIGQPGDPTNDATLPWPDTRQQIDAGTLTLDQIQAEDTTPTALLNFDPLVLPPGIAPSDDPLLSARSAVYSASFTRRSGEQKPPSAITPSDVNQKGAQ